MDTANDYLDYELKAVKPVTRYQGDLKTVVDVVNQGSIVGKIYSWKVDAAGNVWWMLYESWKPGSAMFVKHDGSALLPVPPSGTKIEVTTPGFLTDFANAAGTVGTQILIPVLIAIVGIFLLTRRR
jgi:hypothetical protein